MPPSVPKTICWSPIWSEGFERCGFEHVILSETGAHSTLIVVDDDGQPFRLAYRLTWDPCCRIREADFDVYRAGEVRQLKLRSDGEGYWHDATGRHLPTLDGCIDIDIWPTPLTNSLPIWRSALQVGQRHAFRMAWVSAPLLSVEPKPQAYTRTGDRLYCFESLDAGGFQAELTVDDDDVVIDYPGLFRRVPRPG